VDDITPDFIARMASRIYNEIPHGNGAPHKETAAPEVPSPPAGMQPFVGSVPVSVTTLPPATPIASVPMIGNTSEIPALPGIGVPSSLPGISSMPSMPTSFSPPGMPTPKADQMPEHPALPGFATSPAPAPTSSGGLGAFVQKIRRSHHVGEDRGHGKTPRPHHEEIGSNAAAVSMGTRPLDVPAIREEFPVLRQKVHGKPLAWLDNAATTQKPQSVIDTISRFYEQDYSNIHRGAHTLAARATDAYEKARQKVQTFLGASSPKEIVFVRGTTEGINLITQTFGRKFLHPGDEVVLSILEHHANIVPWQMLAKERSAVLRVIPVNDRGEIMLEEYQRLLSSRTKVVALAHASNSLGTILPIAEMTQMAKRYNARVLIDGAQSVAHLAVNMQQLGADFFVFSGHKIFGPTGIGAVYIKEELHDLLPPWHGGGNMIRNVTIEETSYADTPAKWEAGTPNIADAVGLGAALDYVNRLGIPNIGAYEHKLLEYATDALSRINGLRLIGTAKEKVGVLSFVLPNRRTEEIGRLLDGEGIAVRAGHHCAQPSLRRFGVETTVRPSLSLYNTTAEIDRLVEAIKRIQRLP
jgi:cysteine desulfurase / selenocysteine lyase